MQSIWGVLLAPEKTFRALAVRPHWLPALLLLVVAALGAVAHRHAAARHEAGDPRGDRGQRPGDSRRRSSSSRSRWRRSSSGWGRSRRSFSSRPIYMLMAGDLPGRLSPHGQRDRLPPQPLGHGARHDAVPARDPAHHPGGAVARRELAMEDVQSGGFLHSNLALLRPESTGKAMRSPCSRAATSSRSGRSPCSRSAIASSARCRRPPRSGVVLDPLGGGRRRKDRPCRIF